MSKQGTIRRYSLILEKIRRNQYPSFETIKDYLYEFGFNISLRTIQRDIQQIREEFGVEITYNRVKNGYYIDYESSVNIESFFKFLEIVDTAELLTENLRESKETLNYISFEDVGNHKGIQNLKPILQAIKSTQVISFLHYNFHTNKRKQYSIKPYLLKEYQSRWYVVGVIDELDEFRTFGIDRIENLEVTATQFKRDSQKNGHELFANIIGVVYSINELQKVVLSFTPAQGKYIKTLPLHYSQKIIIDNEIELRIELFIQPNYELTQKILMNGEAVKVIEPKWLADEIKYIAKVIVEKY
tara:strand:+ start:100 stop:999 length:900 start_codon:yes stop_codon:yes gene_type:complete